MGDIRRCELKRIYVTRNHSALVAEQWLYWLPKLSNSLLHVPSSLHFGRQLRDSMHDNKYQIIRSYW